MSEQHLNTLSFATRLFERIGLGECAGNVSRLFVDASRDRAEGRLWTALHLERAASTVGCTGEITERLAVDHRAGRRQKLACRTDIDVALFVEPEVFPTKGPVLALRLVDDRNLRGDVLVLDEPAEVGA
jgi:hypothetical protein